MRIAARDSKFAKRSEFFQDFPVPEHGTAYFNPLRTTATLVKDLGHLESTRISRFLMIFYQNIDGNLSLLGSETCMKCCCVVAETSL